MKKEKKKFKFQLKHLIVIVVIILYLILCFFALQSNKNTKEEKNPIYIVLGADHKFTYLDGKIEKGSDADWNQAFGTRKFYTYNDGTYLGQYNLMQYNTQIYAFDDTNDSVNISGFLFAYASDQQIDVVNTSYVEYDENIGAALEYLVEGSTIVIPPVEQLTMLQKIPVDLDGDKENEVVYAINSGGNQDNPQRFSFLCYEDDGEIYRIISNTGNVNDSKMMHYYSIAQIMDLDGDNKKELIVRDIQYGTAAVERYMIYKQKDDDYQLISVET